jgi:hypothetical protein
VSGPSHKAPSSRCPQTKVGFFINRQAIEKSGYITYVPKACNLHFIMFVGGWLHLIQCGVLCSCSERNPLLAGCDYAAVILTRRTKELGLGLTDRSGNLFGLKVNLGICDYVILIFAGDAQTNGQTWNLEVGILRLRDCSVLQFTPTPLVSFESPALPIYCASFPPRTPQFAFVLLKPRLYRRFHFLRQVW